MTRGAIFVIIGLVAHFRALVEVGTQVGQQCLPAVESWCRAPRQERSFDVALVVYDRELSVRALRRRGCEILPICA